MNADRRNCLFLPLAVSLFNIWGQQQPFNAASDSAALNSLEQEIKELDFRNADLKDVLRMIAKKYHLNLIVANDLDQKITLYLSNVRVGDVLQFIAEDNDLILQRINNIYKITRLAEKAAPPKQWDISYENGTLWADFKEEEVRSAMNAMSQIIGKTILLDRNVEGTLTGLVNALPVEEGLRQLLKVNGYHLHKENSYYLVQQSFSLTREEASGGNVWITTTGGKIDAEFNEVPLKTALQALSRETGFNLFLLGSPEGMITGRAHDLTLEECLTHLLLNSNYTFKKSRGVYVVGKSSNKALVSSHFIKLKHLKVDGIVEKLPQNLIQRAELQIVAEHNALSINGPINVLTEIAGIIETIDQPVPQIFFEALVVDFRLSASREVAIEAGLNGPKNPDSSREKFDLWLPGIDVLWSAANVNRYLEKLDGYLSGVNIGRLPKDFYVKIKALESAGKANIRSKPQISTLNGHTAELKIGETRYFKLISETPLRDPSQIYLSTTERFQAIDINISLKITPWVTETGEITIEIQPEFNTPGEQLSPEIPPNIQSRSLNSTVRLRDGETIILGGLIQEVDSERVEQIPLLGKIPLLGRLFKSSNHQKSKSELIIYVTPHLLYPDHWMSIH